MNNTKKHFPVFYTIYFALIAIVIAAVAILIGRLTATLDEYEKSQPKYAAAEIYEKYFEDSVDYSALLDIAGFKTSEFESKETLIKYLKEQNSGELSYYRVTAGVDKSVFKYIVRMGDVKICTFILEKDEDDTGKFKNYKLSSLELYYNATESLSVTIPSNTTLYLNGKPVGDEYIKESGIKTDSCDYMPDGVEGITLTKYEFSGLFYQPEVKVISASGGDCTVVSENNVYTAEIPYSEELETEWKDQIISIVKDYAVYMQGDAEFSTISGYFEYGSDLYEMIRTVENMFVISHYAWSFEGETASEFYRYDDGTFSCRVSVTHLLHRWGVDDYRDFIDMTLYLREIDGKYYIYNRQNH